MQLTRKAFLAGMSAAAVTGWSRLFATERPFGAGARAASGRIQRLLARALAADIRPNPVAVEYDPADMSLPEPVRIGKRLKEYISAQPVTLRADEELVGWLTFDGSVESDLFPRIGHQAFARAAFGESSQGPQGVQCGQEAVLLPAAGCACDL